MDTIEIEWYGRLVRIIFRGPRRFVMGRTGKFFYLHLFFVGFAYRSKLS